MIGPVSRILVRYIAGYLVVRSILPQDIANQIANDPDVIMVAGVILGGAVEGFYALAKWRGWRT